MFIYLFMSLFCKRLRRIAESDRRVTENIVFQLKTSGKRQGVQAIQKTSNLERDRHTVVALEPSASSRKTEYLSCTAGGIVVHL